MTVSLGLEGEHEIRLAPAAPAASIFISSLRVMSSINHPLTANCVIILFESYDVPESESVRLVDNLNISTAYIWSRGEFN
ncbi:MAG: hypothetical protein HOI23_02090 [Deltaproteobacteria bacterium]|nr:hypothetical protein [Deltaproteobacteria bacterium]MBT6434504.1 hypothetical protein [Deltaproteobacteria bacterium]